jgi:hypothetical protein
MGRWPSTPRGTSSSSGGTRRDGRTTAGVFGQRFDTNRHYEWGRFQGQLVHGRIQSVGGANEGAITPAGTSSSTGRTTGRDAPASVRAAGVRLELAPAGAVVPGKQSTTRGRSRRPSARRQPNSTSPGQSEFQDGQRFGLFARACRAARRRAAFSSGETWATGAQDESLSIAVSRRVISHRLGQARARRMGLGSEPALRQQRDPLTGEFTSEQLHTTATRAVRPRRAVRAAPGIHRSWTALQARIGGKLPGHPGAPLDSNGAALGPGEFPSNTYTSDQRYSIAIVAGPGPSSVALARLRWQRRRRVRIFAQASARQVPNLCIRERSPGKDEGQRGERPALVLGKEQHRQSFNYDQRRSTRSPAPRCACFRERKHGQRPDL